MEQREIIQEYKITQHGNTDRDRNTKIWKEDGNKSIKMEVKRRTKCRFCRERWRKDDGVKL